MVTVPTLSETNIAPENRPSQKETSIPTIHFQVLISFREGKGSSKEKGTTQPPNTELGVMNDLGSEPGIPISQSLDARAKIYDSTMTFSPMERVENKTRFASNKNRG